MMTKRAALKDLHEAISMAQMAVNQAEEGREVAKELIGDAIDQHVEVLKAHNVINENRNNTFDYVGLALTITNDHQVATIVDQIVNK